MGCDKGHYTSITCTFNHRSRPLPWQCAVPHAGMPHSAPAYPPHANLNGEKPKLWAVPVGCSRARHGVSLPGPTVTAPVTCGLFLGRGRETTWCERRSRWCPLQAGRFGRSARLPPPPGAEWTCTLVLPLRGSVGGGQWPRQSRPVRRHPSCAAAGPHTRGTLCAWAP